MKKNNYPLKIFLIFILSLFIGVCSSQITTFPHNTDFELGLGADWINATGDDFDWTHKSGSSTPSGGTGPQSAPYGALGTNGYMFIESSTPNYPSKQAWLDGRCDFSAVASPQITVNYHMYASNGVNYGPGLLQLDVYDGSTWTYDVWNNTNGDINWQSTTIDLSAYAGLSYVILSWTGYTVGWQSDICLDELLIEDANPSAPFVVDTYPYEEGFDLEPNASTACCSVVNLSSQGWSNDNEGNDDCDWKPRDVNTPSLNTGPTADQSGGGSYLYMEASSCYSKTAYLISPKFDFTQELSPFIQFYYHMYGSSVAIMSLEWSLDQVQWFPAWSQSGDQGNSWKLGFVDLPILKGVEAYFRITGTTGTDYMSDMAFDGFQGFGGGQPLPIDLVSFSGELDPSGSIVILEWSTASQVNNDYFEIQRSTDVEEWQTISIIAGAGTTNQQIDYNSLDYEPLKGISYYRLKQTDHNGDYKTFNPIAIIIEEPKPHVLDRIINTMGQEVDDSYNGLIIEIYQDGTSTKKYKLNNQ